MTEFVAIQTLTAGARALLADINIGKGFSIVEKGFSIVEKAKWVKLAADAALTVKTDAKHEAFANLVYKGPTERGMWVTHVPLSVLQKVGGAPVWKAGNTHLSMASYSFMRSQYFDWWVKAKQCEGWSHEVPEKKKWVSANEPTPAEMKAYKTLVDQFVANDGEADGMHLGEIHLRAPRCDRDMKILKLAQARKKK